MAALTGEPLVVRPAASGDVPALCGLVCELGYAGTAEEIAARLARIVADDSQAVRVAERGGRVVGWVQVQMTNLLESEPRGEIVGLVVTAAERGRGIGAALVHAAEDWARGRGLTLMGVRSNQVRLDAHRFYQRLGYAEAKTQLSFRKQLRNPSA